MNAGIWKGGGKIVDATHAPHAGAAVADPSDMGAAAVFLADPSYLFHTATNSSSTAVYSIF